MNTKPNNTAPIQEEWKIFEKLKSFTFKKPNRPAINGVLFDSKNDRIVASDGRYLLSVLKPKLIGSGLYHYKDKSLISEVYPDYIDYMYSKNDQLTEYTVNTGALLKYVNEKIPLIGEDYNDVISCAFKIGKSQVIVFDLKVLLKLLVFLVQQKNENFVIATKKIGVNHYTGGFIKCKAFGYDCEILVSPVIAFADYGDEKLISKDIAGINYETHENVYGIFDLTRPAVKSDRTLALAAAAQAQRLKLLKLKSAKK